MRKSFLDVWRGVAVFLLVLDHSLLVSGFCPELRFFTRSAMPLFMLLSGGLWQRHNFQRLLEVASVACLVFFLGHSLGWPVYILFSWLLCQPLMGFVSRWPLPFALFGYSLSVFFPLGGLDYHPGEILFFLSLGRLIRFPEVGNIPFLAFAGRRPLSFYSIHFVGCWFYFQRGFYA